MLNIYSIFDIKTRTWSAPQAHEDNPEDPNAALFALLNVMINTHGESQAHLYPDDFVVYKLGCFDDEIGDLVSFHDKELVTTLSSLKRHCEHCEQKETNDD